MIESITDGFLTLNNKWEFTYVNKHQHFPQRKTAKDVLGKNIWEVFPSSVDTVIYKELHRVMSERTTVHFEFFLLLMNIGMKLLHIRMMMVFVVFVKHNRKQYEQELKRLSNIELIGQMAAGISHEIRNPMTTIRGFLQLLKEENNYEKHNNYFNLMVEELDRANSIITEFLSIGNTKKSDLQMLDLNSIIHDIIPLIKIDTHNQNKYIQVDTNDVPALLLNRNEIRQLLMNLYRNGLEAMSTGKTLTISTYKEGQNCVVLAVRDEGKGISPEVLEKLGTPFYTTKDNGTGLGLGVCYAIATRHNAKIEIQTGSEGTTFLLNLIMKIIKIILFRLVTVNCITNKKLKIINISGGNPMAMSNNDILKRVRYALDIKDIDMVEIFKLGGMEVTKEDVVDMLTKIKRAPQHEPENPDVEEDEYVKHAI